MAEDEKYELPSVDGAPWLIGTHENDDAKLEEQTFFSMNKNTSYIKKIVELQGKWIVGSSVGWLILQDRVNETMYSLWNPITRQSILLPELLGTPGGGDPEWCMLTSPPYEDGFDDNAMTKCVVLFIFSGAVFSCRITRTKDDYRWVKQRLMHRGLRVLVYRAVTMNGDIYSIANTYDNNNYYYVDNEDDYIVDNEEDYDVVNEEEDDGIDNTLFIRLKVSDHSDGRSNLVRVESLRAGRPFSSIVYKMGQRDVSYLVEVSGDLYAVNIIPRQIENLDGYDILKAFVWRFDLSEMKWIQVESLGNRSLLLSDNNCTWCWADESSQGQIEGNCIYVARYGTDNIHQYRLQDTSYTFVSSHSNFSFCSVVPIWFMPRNPTRLSSLVGEAEHVTVENTKHVELLEETRKEIVPASSPLQLSLEAIISITVENTKHVELSEATSTGIVPASSLLQLPPEIIISIADRMRWFDCFNFRATCKITRSEIPKPQLRANNPFPLFLFLRNTLGICELWDPCYQNNNVSITKKLPYSPSIVSTIEFCKDDWLMLRSHEGCYLQYMNIFTGERGEYPIKLLPGGLTNFAFSTCPTSPDCLTIGFYSYYTCVQISLLHAGDDEWEVIQLNIEDDVNFRSNYKSSPKYHNGAFYFLGENGHLGVLKIMDGKRSWVAHKGPLREDESSKVNECYIAELGEQLVYVFIQPFGSSVKVYSFDMDQKLWVELRSLGDYTLFVSAASSLSVPTKDRSMRNRIYLPKRIGNEMVFFSLDTGKYHTSSSKDSFENFCGMNSQTFCCWV